MNRTIEPAKSENPRSGNKMFLACLSGAALSHGWMR